jgi:hypothetical protein
VSSNKTLSMMSSGNKTLAMICRTLMMINSKSLTTLLRMTPTNLTRERGLSIVMLLSFAPTKRSHRSSSINSIACYSVWALLRPRNSRSRGSRDQGGRSFVLPLKSTTELKWSRSTRVLLSSGLVRRQYPMLLGKL